MCNHKYQKDSRHFKDKHCIYPNLYITNTDKFLSENSILPIDDEGLCIFHSRNVSWKLQNNFREKFDQLVQVITKINSNINKNLSEYNFSGFFFCTNGENFLMDNYTFEGNLDLSYSFFANEFCFSNSKIHSLDLTYSVHSKRFRLNKVNFNGIVSSSVAKFENGIRFTDCTFDRDIFFDKCTFSNTENRIINSTILEACSFLENIDFSNSTFNFITCFQKLIFNGDANFNECIFTSEFKFNQNELSGRVDFGRSQFLLESNPNPNDSATSFRHITLNKKGSLIFKGVQPFEDVVKGEMEIHFKTEPEGIVSFENFNLNKIFHDHKINLLKLWKIGKVMIGGGCLKYLYQTPKIEIESSDATQKLIIDITQVFSNFFEKNYGYNLGIEIIERTKNKIIYFYFSDDIGEVVSNEYFCSKIEQNEFDFWQTFSNLASISSNAQTIEGLSAKLFFMRMSLIFAEISELIKLGTISFQDLKYVLDSVSPYQKSIISNLDYLQEYLKNNILLNKPQITLNMNNNVTVTGGINNLNFNENQSNVIQQLSSQNQFNDFDKKIFEAKTKFSTDAIQEILDLIAAIQIAEALSKIDNLGIKDEQLEVLRQKFILGKTEFSFYEELKAFILQYKE